MASNIEFLTHVYENLWGRDPDASGLAYWAEQMEDGLSSGEVMSQMLTSPDFEQSYMDLGIAYRVLLDKNPDKDGLHFWSNALKQGLPLNSFIDFVFNETGFLENYPYLTNQGFVEILYQKALGREADTGGLVYWTGMLDQQLMTMVEMIEIFVQLPEAHTYAGDEIRKDMLAQTLIGRELTAEEDGEYFTLDYEDVTQLLLDSSENIAPFPEDFSRSQIDFTLSEDGLLSFIPPSKGVVDVVIDDENSTFSVYDAAVAIEHDYAELPEEIDASMLIDDMTVFLDESGISVTTGYGDDLLYGGEDDDTFNAGAGEDYFFGGAGEDLFIIDKLIHASGFEEIYYGQADFADIQVNENGYLDLSDASISQIDEIMLAEDALENTLVISMEQLDEINLITGGNGMDWVEFTTAGIVDLTGNQFFGVEGLIASDDGDNEFIGSSNDEYFYDGDDNDLIKPGTGIDYISLGRGDDVVSYQAINESQFTAGNKLDIDTIDGFDFKSEDQFSLPVTIDGTISTHSISSAFVSNLQSLLENDTTIQTAFADADNDMVLLSIDDGTAAGDYLLVEGGGTDTTFTIADDMLIRLTGAQNTNYIDSSDFLLS